MKFNIEDYKGNYAMHCKTEEEAKDFCRYLDSIGRKWSSEDSYAELTEWNEYKEKTCYCFNNDTYSSVSNYTIKHNYQVLEWGDFMNNEFTKADLKTGDVVLRRNGVVEIVCLETKSLVSKDGFNCLFNVNEDLTSGLSFAPDFDWDIIAVRRPEEPYECQFCAFDKGYGEIVYERKEPEEMTFEEVCKALGKKIKIVKKY